MKVLLAGASGVLGQRTAAALRAAGHEVAGLGRGAGMDVRADLLDREGLLRAVEGRGFDAVVHAATALAGKAMARHQDMAGTNRLRTEGTVNLLAAARETGARRFVVESMMFGYGYGDHGGALIGEDDGFGPRGTNVWLERHVGAMRTKEELAFTADGIEGVSLRFGLFYGEGVTDSHLVPLLRGRKLPVVAAKGRALSWVDVADAARAVALAVDAGRAGEAYNVADDAPAGWGEHMGAVARAFGAPDPMTVPLWVLRPAPLAHAIMGTDLRMSNAKARRELGWLPGYGSSLDGVRALALAGAGAGVGRRVAAA